MHRGRTELKYRSDIIYILYTGGGEEGNLSMPGEKVHITVVITPLSVCTDMSVLEYAYRTRYNLLSTVWGLIVIYSVFRE